ncbi:hypothetical protein [Colwellia sp. MEBiC06753]
MKAKVVLPVICLVICIVSLDSFANADTGITKISNINDHANTCDQSEHISFVTNDVFNLSEADTIFLHRWANFLHNKTNIKTLENESAFFISKCTINEHDLQELERHLRKKKYIRDAIVTRSADNKILVETWDNWSLLPTIDISRKGGKNKFGIGILERNLLGYGIDSELEYFSDDQRSGYKFKSEFPLYMGNNTNARIRLTDNDDGSSQAIFLEKKFVSFDTQYAYKVGFDNFNQIDTLYEQGEDANEYHHKQSYTTASGYWLYKNTNKSTLRFGLGYTEEQHTFRKLSDPDIDILYPNAQLPSNRDFSYPFFSAQYLQKDYRELKNVNLINQIEDFNLGWFASINIGHDFYNNDYSPDLIWQSYLSKGLDLGNEAYWLFAASFEGEVYQNSQQDDRILLKTSAEYFHKFNDAWGGYFKNANVVSQHQFLDKPVELGAESGVRGYPLQYQHGDHSTQFTVEARYYPHINLYKLIELGGAAFFDAGRMFKPSTPTKDLETWMTSIGIGARLYSTHSSEARVVHFDLIKPISSDPNVDSWEFRVTTKQSF